MLLNSLTKFFDIESICNRAYHSFLFCFLLKMLFKNKKVHYLNIFKLFLRVISLRIAKSRRDLLVIWSNSRSCDIKARMKKLTLRDNKNESVFFKTNSCLFLLREVRRFFIICVMINVNKILSLSKNVFASKNKKTISFEDRLMLFFWMTSSFRRVMNFLSTSLFFFSLSR
jgi:hypothetical protein